MNSNITLRINNPTVTMRISKMFADLLYAPPSPPLGGWIENLDEAFAALNEDGGIACIGYKGEWFFTRKPSIVVRLRNWFVSVYNRQLDGYTDSLPDVVPSTDCRGFRWIGQSFAQCDGCGRPYWEHTHETRPKPGAGAFDDEPFEYVPITDLQRESCRSKWGKH